MHPILFHFKFPIYTYGTLVAVAFLAGLKLAGDRAARQGVDKNVATNVFLAILVGSILGARLLYIAEQWDYFRPRPWEMLMIQHGGL